MGRYARAVYGDSKYGLDLRSEYSVEPMNATLEVDRNLMTPLEQATGSAFTNDRGEAAYNRCQVSWINPAGHSRFTLLRSNLGYPTGPTDPYAKIVVDEGKITHAWTGTPHASTSTRTDFRGDVITNLATNPSFEATSGTVEVWRNLAKNPRATVDMSNSAGWVFEPLWAGNASTNDVTYNNTDPGNTPVGGPTTFARKTWTEVSGFDEISWAFSDGNTRPVVVAGEVYTVGFWWRASFSLGSGGVVKNKVRVVTYDAGGANAGTIEASSTFASPTPGQWQWIQGTVTIPAGVTSVWAHHSLRPEVAMPVGSTLDVTGLVVVKSSVMPSYFDGAYSPDSDLTPSWTGTANESESVLTGPVPAAAYVGANRLVVKSTAWSAHGDASVRIISKGDGSTGFTLTTPTPGGTGATYTVVATMRRDALGAGDRMGGQIWRESGSVVLTPPVDTVGVFERRAVFAAAGTSTVLRFFGDDGPDVWYDGVAIVEGDYTGPYFDGDTVPEWEASPDKAAVTPLPGDPVNRQRYAFLDANVEQGREYFYAAWSRTGDPANNTDEWHLSGRAMTTTSTDHGLLSTLKGALPPYMWNQYVGPGIGVAVMEDPDDENTMSRWLQSKAWELDKTLTKADLLREVWNPQRTPAILLDDAVSMFGLPVEPALGDRASRALLSNAADITGERGTLNSVGLLVESLSGISCDLKLGGNRIPSTDESSFEGLMVQPGTQTVTGGTGRWFISNAALTRVDGDASNADVYVARDPNPDEKVDPGKRFGLRLDSVSHTQDVSMSLGERVRVDALKSDQKVGVATTHWQHGLESGDVVNICINGATAYPVKVLWVVDDFRFQFDAASANAALRDQDLVGILNGWITGGPVPAHQGIPITPEKTYALVGMFQAANAQNFTLKVKYWDRQGNLLGTTTASPTAAVPTAPWTRVYASGATPVGAVAATLEITLTQTGVPQYLAVDSLMMKEGGTRYDGVVSPTETLPYDSSTKYEGDIDYTFEDALLLTVTFDTTRTPAGGPIPFTIQGDLAAVLSSRLTDILTRYLPIGTAFRLEGLVPQEV